MRGDFVGGEPVPPEVAVHGAGAAVVRNVGVVLSAHTMGAALTLAEGQNVFPSLVAARHQVVTCAAARSSSTVV